MPELGAIRHDRDTGETFVFVRSWYGHPPALHLRWMPVRRLTPRCPTTWEEVEALPDGTVIDWRRLPGVVVLKLGGTQLNDDTLEALLREAEAMGEGCDGKA